MWSYRQDQSDAVSVLGASGSETVLRGNQVKDFAANGAIDPAAGTARLTKGSIGAYTLAAPSTNGQRLTIISGSAFAHVVTATSLIQDGVTGGAKTTLTFAAFVGASIDLLASGGTWSVISKNAVTIS